MAKPAKTSTELNDQRALKELNDILGHLGEIDSARGRFAAQAKRERDEIGALYESLAQLGIPQRTSRLNIKIARAIQKIRGWLLELEVEDRKLAEKLAKLQKDRAQLTLFTELHTPVAQSEQPARRGRGRPRKQPQTVDAEPERAAA